MGLLGSPVFLSPEVSSTIAVLKSALLHQMSLLVFVNLNCISGSGKESKGQGNTPQTPLQNDTPDALKQTLFGEMLAEAFRMIALPKFVF